MEYVGTDGQKKATWIRGFSVEENSEGVWLSSTASVTDEPALSLDSWQGNRHPGHSEGKGRCGAGPGVPLQTGENIPTA